MNRNLRHIVSDLKFEYVFGTDITSRVSVKVRKNKRELNADKTIYPKIYAVKCSDSAVTAIRKRITARSQSSANSNS